MVSNLIFWRFAVATMESRTFCGSSFAVWCCSPQCLINFLSSKFGYSLFWVICLLQMFIPVYGKVRLLLKSQLVPTYYLRQSSLAIFPVRKAQLLFVNSSVICLETYLHYNKYSLSFSGTMGTARLFYHWSLINTNLEDLCVPFRTGVVSTVSKLAAEIWKIG